MFLLSMKCKKQQKLVFKKYHKIITFQQLREKLIQPRDTDNCLFGRRIDPLVTFFCRWFVTKSEVLKSSKFVICCNFCLLKQTIFDFFSVYKVKYKNSNYYTILYWKSPTKLIKKCQFILILQIDLVTLIHHHNFLVFG